MVETSEAVTAGQQASPSHTDGVTSTHTDGATLVLDTFLPYRAARLATALSRGLASALAAQRLAPSSGRISASRNGGSLSI